MDSSISFKISVLRGLLDDIERHVEAGAVVKANSRASDLEDDAHRLFNMTYKLAFPDKCPHLGDKTEVQGGGWTCNSCGDYCKAPR